MIKAMVKTNFYKIRQIDPKIWVGSYHQFFKKLGIHPNRCATPSVEKDRDP